ncbi:energy transducer TonB [Marinicella sp. W31]|uniref:energy transducer TonB n=1 Tax=Marinicella sp. W31 TaxID=3023713 RepID=UPI003757AFAB
MKQYIYIFLIILSSFTSAEEFSEMIPVVRIYPGYPPEQLEKKQEGWVELQFDVTEKGHVENPIVIDSYPKLVFDANAISAILKFKFLPRMINRKPVRAKARLTIEFELPEENEEGSTDG